MTRIRKNWVNTEIEEPINTTEEIVTEINEEDVDIINEMHDIDAEEELVKVLDEAVIEETIEEIIEPEKVIEPEEVVIEAPVIEETVKPFNPKNRLYLRTGIMPK